MTWWLLFHTASGVHGERPQTEKIPSEWQLWLGKCLVDDRGQRSELADWLETIERQQEVKREKRPAGFNRVMQDRIFEDTSRTRTRTGRFISSPVLAADG